MLKFFGKAHKKSEFLAILEGVFFKIFQKVLFRYYRHFFSILFSAFVKLIKRLKKKSFESIIATFFENQNVLFIWWFLVVIS